MLFRNLFFSFLVVCLAVPAFAQRTPQDTSTPPAHGMGMGMMRMWGMASDEEIDRSLDVLRQSLNLNDSQVTRIRALTITRRDSLRSIREQARPKFAQLMALLKQPNPDAAAVGRAVLDLKAVHEQARAKQMDVEKQITAILNPTQQQTVNNLRSQAPTFRALRRIGLLGTPELPGFMSSQSESSGDSREDQR